MANWKKVSTRSAEREIVIASADTRSGYRSASMGGNISTYRYYWCVPSGYYGIRRNYRANYSSGPAGEPVLPVNDSLPSSYAGTSQFDNMFEYDVKVRTDHKLKVQWRSTSGHVWPDNSKIWIAIPESDYTYLFSNGYGGDSDTKGIVQATITASIGGYTANDISYNFGYEWTIPTEVVIPKGSFIVLLINNSVATSTGTAKRMRDFICTLECEAT
jgi:hypothetical protein